MNIAFIILGFNASNLIVFKLYIFRINQESIYLIWNICQQTQFIQLCRAGKYNKNKQQIKYIMAFSLNSNNLFVTKMRDGMYIKHLQEVEKINNRQADTLKKQLKYYRCISQLHKNNRLMANKRRIEEINRSIEQKNTKIQHKIKQIGSDEQLKRSCATILTTLKTVNHNKSSLNSEKTADITEFQRSPVKNQCSKTLHHRYRKKVQQQIEQQNNKIFKAILEQKSVLLPIIRRNRATNNPNKSKVTYDSINQSQILKDKKEQGNNVENCEQTNSKDAISQL